MTRMFRLEDISLEQTSHIDLEYPPELDQVESAKLWTWSPIDPSDLSCIDLRDEAESAGAFAGAYRIHIWVEVSQGGIVINELAYPEAEALVVPSASDPTVGRIGVACGADAQWGDVHHIWAPDDGITDDPEHVCDGQHDITQAIEDWLNDETAWEARR